MPSWGHCAKAAYLSEDRPRQTSVREHESTQIHRSLWEVRLTADSRGHKEPSRVLGRVPNLRPPLGSASFRSCLIWGPHKKGSTLTVGTVWVPCFLQFRVLESALGLDVQMWPEITFGHKMSLSLFSYFPNGREGNRFLRGFLITTVYCITKREFSTRKEGTRNKEASWEDRKASHALHLVSVPSLASLLEPGNLFLQISFLGPTGSLVFLTFMFLAWNDVTLHTLVPIFRVLPKILFVYLFSSF